MKTTILDSYGRQDSAGKSIDDFIIKPTFMCHFRLQQHEVGCSHKNWSKEELQSAIVTHKQSKAWQLHLLNFPEDMILTRENSPKPNPPSEE